MFLLTPKQFMAVLFGYLALGGAGLPVFSGMRGGIGVLAGPTGGFLWGYIIGSALALLFLHLVNTHRARKAKEQLDLGVTEDLTAQQVGKKAFALSIVAGVIYLAFAYVCGWLQYIFIANVDPVAAFMVTVAPFIIIDLIKIVAAAIAAQAVKRALSL